MVNTLPQNTHLGMVYNSRLYVYIYIYIDKVMTGALDALGDGLWHYQHGWLPDTSYVPRWSVGVGVHLPGEGY